MSKEKPLWQRVQEHVYLYPTESPVGFTRDEYLDLLQSYNGVNMDKFYEALSGITCQSIDGVTRIYHTDIEKAVMCGLQNRGLLAFEFD